MYEIWYCLYEGDLQKANLSKKIDQISSTRRPQVLIIRLEITSLIVFIYISTGISRLDQVLRIVVSLHLLLLIAFIDNILL